MPFKLNKSKRGGDQVDPFYYRPRPATGGPQPRTFNNAKPLPVDTLPTFVSKGNPPDSFVYRQGRDPAHQYSRATTPLHFNPSYGSEFTEGFIPGSKVHVGDILAVPRTQNRGMQPVTPRTNQVRPNTVSYGSQSLNPTTISVPRGGMRKWFT